MVLSIKPSLRNVSTQVAFAVVANNTASCDRKHSVLGLLKHTETVCACWEIYRVTCLVELALRGRYSRDASTVLHARRIVASVGALSAPNTYVWYI